MSVNFLAKFKRANHPVDKRPLRARSLRSALLLVWMAAGFGLALLVLQALLYSLELFGVSLVDFDETLYKTSVMALLYALTAAIIIGVPWLVKRYRTSKEELGLTRLLSWGDIGLAPLALVVYFMLAWLLMAATQQIVPALDLTQVQETGFSGIQDYYYQYIVVMIALVVVAPIAEELLFRGYLYGKLRQLMPLWVAVLITSLAFGAVHGQWNVAIDVFALSLVLCSLREITGSIWAGILLHMLKNAIAYYALFIYPLT